MSQDTAIEMELPVAYLPNSQSAVYFSIANSAAGTFQSNKGTALPVKALQNVLKVAYWGEDNRFPQNIEQQMAYCGVGKAALNWKANALWGNGIIPGKIVGFEDGGEKEVFEPLDTSKYKIVYNFLNSRSIFRFFLEYNQDWTWYFNNFPELILSKDGKTITGFVHQESNDCRYQQMDDKGTINKVFLSKLWGCAGNQYAKFDPERRMKGLIENAKEVTEVDNIFVKALDCIDMYDAVSSLENISKKLVSSKGKKAFKSAILPVNYPSPNKTYYQVPYWDGARLGGWVEIAAKIPSLIKTMYNKAFTIKYHIQIPETYFQKLYGIEKWAAMKQTEKSEARKKLLKQMDDFLTGDKNAYKSFLSFFDVDPHTKQEYGLIKITVIDDKSNIDKEMITQSAADIQLLVSMGINPTLFGAGTIGTGQQRSGGSDMREAWLIYTANLNLERQVMLEPLYVMRDYNREIGGVTEWEDDIVFRIRDTVLTTLDTGAGTAKVVS